MNYKVLCSTLNQSKDEWLKMRKLGIGGSDVGALTGISKYKSPSALYLEKIDVMEQEFSPEAEERMYWGATLEEVVAKEFTIRTGKKVRRRNAMFQSIEHPFMLANVDREVAGENAGLECKTTGAFGGADWEDNQIPQVYQLQCFHYMAVMGWTKMYICCLIGGQKFIMRELNRDEEIIKHITHLEEDFWNKILNKTMPVIDGSDSSTELLDKLYPVAKNNAAINLPATFNNGFSEIERLTDVIKDLEEQKSLYENSIKIAMGENEIGFAEGYKITWKNVNSVRFDSKRFKSDNEGLYNQYAKPSLYRRLSIKKIDVKGDN